MKDVASARPPWDAGLVLVCRECDGFSGKLKHALEDAVDEAGFRKRIRVVESECFDVCPKRATTIVTVAADGPRVSLVPASLRRPSELAPLLRHWTSCRSSE